MELQRWLAVIIWVENFSWNVDKYVLMRYEVDTKALPGNPKLPTRLGPDLKRVGNL